MKRRGWLSLKVLSIAHPIPSHTTRHSPATMPKHSPLVDSDGYKLNKMWRDGDFEVISNEDVKFCVPSYHLQSAS